MEERYIRHQGPVHNWFSLSYASYLTLPRSLLQEMPLEWQERLVGLLLEMGQVFPMIPKSGQYHVSLRAENGRFLKDRLNQYRRPNIAYIESLMRPSTLQEARAEDGPETPPS